MSDDFERAVLYSFEQNNNININNEQKQAEFQQEKERYLVQLSSFVRTREAWKICAERYERTNSVEVQFWCLQTISHKLENDLCNNSNNNSNNNEEEEFTIEERQMVRNTIEKYVSAFQQENASVRFPVFIQNKLAQCVAHAVASEGPANRWPNFFENLIHVLVTQSLSSSSPSSNNNNNNNNNNIEGDKNSQQQQQQSNTNSDNVKEEDNKTRVQFFLRILDCLDADVINSTDALRKGHEFVKRSGRVKDYMRERNISMLLFDTFLTVANSFSRDCKILAQILHVASKYVDWVDVNIIASDGFMSFVSACSGHSNEELRAASCQYLTSLVDKGMDAEKKFLLITRFNLVEACSTLVTASFQEDEDDDEQFAMNSLSFLQSLGNELLSALNTVSPTAANSKGGKNSVKERVTDCLRTAESDQLCNLLLVLATQAATYGILSKHESAVSLAIQFLIQYSNRMKSDSFISSISIPMFQETLLKNIIDRSSFEFVKDCGANFADANDEYAMEQEGDVFALRQELMVLFRNISRASSEPVLKATQAYITLAVNNGGEVFWYRVDAALSAIYNLGESSGFTDAVANHEMRMNRRSNNEKNKNSQMGATTTNNNNNNNNSKGDSQSVDGVHSLNVNSYSDATAAAVVAAVEAPPQEQVQLTALVLSLVLKWEQCSKNAAYHRIVSLSFMELCVRYHNMIEQNAEALHLVLRVFLDERGMRHPDQMVSGRACYLFMRMIKPVRSQLSDKVDDIFTALEKPLTDAAQPLSQKMLEDIQAKTAHLASNLSVGTRVQGEEGNDDRLYVFEAAGLILGAEEVPEKQQCERLMQVLQALCGRIVEFVHVGEGVNGALASQNAMRCVVALSNLAKGFTARICVEMRPKVGEIFRSTMEVTMSCLKRWPREKGVRHRVIGFLHQMIQILNHLVVPYLPDAVDALRSNGANSKELGETLVLINQLSNTFKEALIPMIAPIFLSIRQQIHENIRIGLSSSSTLASASANIIGNNSSSDDFTREAHELERNWIQLINTFSLTSVLSPLLAANADARVLCLQELVENAQTNGSISIRKLCLQSLKQIVIDWIGTPANPVGDEFITFAVQKIGIECCLGPPLFDYNLRDAGSIQAVNECFAIQKILLLRIGEPFATLLSTNVLPSLLSAKVDQNAITNCASAYLNLLSSAALATDSSQIKPKDIRLLFGEIASMATLPPWKSVVSPCNKS
jgi:exportin-T